MLLSDCASGFELRADDTFRGRRADGPMANGDGTRGARTRTHTENTRFIHSYVSISPSKTSSRAKWPHSADRRVSDRRRRLRARAR